MTATLAVRELVGRLIDGLPHHMSASIRKAVGRPGVRLVGLEELDAEFATVAALFASAPDEACLGRLSMMTTSQGRALRPGFGPGSLFLDGTFRPHVSPRRDRIDY